MRVPGISTPHEAGFVAMLIACVLSPLMLALWLATIPFAIVNYLASIVLSGATQHDWLKLFRVEGIRAGDTGDTE